MTTLEDFPRYPLLFGPSPIQPLPRLTKHLGGARLWAKREDYNSGYAFGGNKARKLEYLVADALAPPRHHVASQPSSHWTRRRRRQMRPPESSWKRSRPGAATAPAPNAVPAYVVAHDATLFAIADARSTPTGFEPAAAVVRRRPGKWRMSRESSERFSLASP